MLYRMPDSNRSREEGLIFILYNYVLSCGNVLVLNCKCACVKFKIWLHLVRSILHPVDSYISFSKTVCYR